MGDLGRMSLQLQFVSQRFLICSLWVFMRLSNEEFIFIGSVLETLTYGAAVKDLTGSETQQLNVAVNNAVRRIFGFRRWESIRQIRQFYHYDSIEVLFAKAKKRFELSLPNHANCVLRFLFLVSE